MNQQKRTLLIAICGMLALVLLVLLVVTLNRRGPDQPTLQTDSPAITDAPTAEPDTEPTKPPLSEEEMGRQALSEEEGEHEEIGLEDEEELPVD